MAEHVFKYATDCGGVLTGDDCARVPLVAITVEHGSVELRTDISSGSGIDTGIIYLTPLQAMQMSLAFERCAIQALKDGAK